VKHGWEVLPQPSLAVSVKVRVWRQPLSESDCEQLMVGAAQLSLACTCELTVLQVGCCPIVGLHPIDPPGGQNVISGAVVSLTVINWVQKIEKPFCELVAVYFRWMVNRLGHPPGVTMSPQVTLTVPHWPLTITEPVLQAGTCEAHCTTRSDGQAMVQPVGVQPVTVTVKLQVAD